MAGTPRAYIVALALACLAPFGCSKAGSVNESRPLTKDFDGYKTGTVEVDTAGLEGGGKGGPELRSYLEKQLETNGVLQPLSVAQGAQLIVRVRAAPNSGDEEPHVFVDFVDARSRETVGQLLVSATGLGEKDGASRRRVATAIADYMRKNRRAPPTEGPKGGAVGASVTPTTDRPLAGVATAGACKTVCTTDSSSSLPIEDQTRLAEGFLPMLEDIRTCLDRINAESIHPAVILRFEPNGLLSQLKIDAGGYDEMSCMQNARSRTPHLALSRAASVRCEYRCAR